MTSELQFDTSCDEGRIEKGKLFPVGESVLLRTQSGVRPNFRLEPDGSVTLISKQGLEVPNFGSDGRIVNEND